MTMQHTQNVVCENIIILLIHINVPIKLLFGIDVDVGEMASIRSPLPIKRRAILLDRLLHIYVENVKKNSMCSSNKCDRAENVL